MARLCHPVCRLLGPLLTLALASAAAATEVRIRYPVFEQLVRGALFDASGRHYLHGSADTLCNYAYLDQPAVSPAGERLLISMVFHGRAAARIGQRCLGPADAVEVWLSGRPVSDGESVVLSDLEVEAGGRFYDALVDTFLRDRLRETLRFPLRPLFAGSWQGDYRVRIAEIEVSTITVTSHALLLSLDFALEVEPSASDEP